MNLRLERSAPEKILDRDGRVTGIEVTIRIFGGSLPGTFTTTFPAADENRLEAAIKDFAVASVREYERDFQPVEPEVRQIIDPATVPFDASAIITEARG